jgi:hypothetical protein
MIEHYDPNIWAYAEHHTAVFGGGFGDRIL